MTNILGVRRVSRSGSYYEVFCEMEKFVVRRRTRLRLYRAMVLLLSGMAPLH